MAVYAIGDVQGCYEPMRRLLDRLGFEPERDRLWLTGDLVNRGPASLDVLRFVRGLGSRAVTVLGNHDLHLLALAAGVPGARRRRRDTLDEVLTAPDRDELLEWLRHRPAVHYAEDPGWLLVHAGVPPQWDLPMILDCARELEATLRSTRYREFLAHMYGDEPLQWNSKLGGHDRLRFIVNCFTRMRYCDGEGRLDLDAKGEPGSQRRGYLPWFRVPGRASAAVPIVFGHWSTLGGLQEDRLIALDTGCVWGKRLTAARLDVRQSLVSVRCKRRGQRN